MYTQTENAQNHDPRTKPPYLYCQLSANGYYRKRSFLFKDTNSHDLFAFQSNSVFTLLLNGIPVSGHSLISGLYFSLLYTHGNNFRSGQF